MPVPTTPLSPNAFIAFSDAEQYVYKGAAGGESLADANFLVTLINNATAALERYTGRALHWRNYTVPVTPAGTWTAQAPTQLLHVNGTNVPAGSWHGGDDLTAVVGVQACRVALPAASLAFPANTANLTPTSNVTADPGQVTFGSAPMLLDGHGGRDVRLLRLPEWPLVTLFSANFIGGDGTLTPVNTTNAVIDYANARIKLTNDTLPRGPLTLQIEACCGYLQPSTNTLGNPPEAWEDLSFATTLLVDAYWQQWQKGQGREDRTQAGQFSSVMGKATLPPDVCAILAKYRRRGG